VKYCFSNLKYYLSMRQYLFKVLAILTHLIAETSD